jgi:DNA repair protein RadC
MELCADEHGAELCDAGAGLGWRQTSPAAATPDRTRSVLAEFLDIFRPGDGSAIAYRLIKESGSLHRLLSLSQQQLEAALPEAPELAQPIALTRRLLDESLMQSLRARPIKPCSKTFERYLKYVLGSYRDEHLRIFFMSAGMTLLAEDDHTRRSPAHVSISIRALMARALELGACGIILAHNHPSGTTIASPEDIALTRSIAQTGRTLGIQVIDHFVVANMSVRSILKECAL